MGFWSDDIYYIWQVISGRWARTWPALAHSSACGRDVPGRDRECGDDILASLVRSLPTEPVLQEGPIMGVNGIRFFLASYVPLRPSSSEIHLGTTRRAGMVETIGWSLNSVLCGYGTQNDEHAR